jgi:hypothetical protein
MKYVWIQAKKDTQDKQITIIDDPVSIFTSGQFNMKTDSLYQLGSEVKLKVILETVPSKREVSADSFSRTKDSLGVGDYRG